MGSGSRARTISGFGGIVRVKVTKGKAATSEKVTLSEKEAKDAHRGFEKAVDECRCWEIRGDWMKKVAR